MSKTRTGTPCIGKYHGDAAAHGAAADDGGLLDFADRSFGIDAGNLRAGALRQESVNQSLGLIAGEALARQIALDLAAFLEGLGGCRFQGLQNGDRSRLNLADSSSPFRGQRQ